MADNARGFTLIEVLLVIGLFAIVAGLVVSVGLHTHSGFSAQGDEDLAIATLQKARSQSMHGVCTGDCVAAVAHGVHSAAHGLVLFQGGSFDPTDAANENLPALSNATTFAGADIIFAPLTGVADATATLTIFDNGSSTSAITVGTEGQLSWSN